jgi:hypothetical protein
MRKILRSLFIGLAVHNVRASFHVRLADGAIVQPLHRSPYIVWTRLFLKTYINKKLHPILIQHIRAYTQAATYKLTLTYFLVNIHINNQSILDKVNSIMLGSSKLYFELSYIISFGRQMCPRHLHSKCLSPITYIHVSIYPKCDINP